MDLILIYVQYRKVSKLEMILKTVYDHSKITTMPLQLKR